MRVQRRLDDHKNLILNLAASLGHGGEARVYALPNDENLVAKIYHQPTSVHAQKLATMIANPPDNPTAALGHISIAWPVDLLQAVDNSDKVIGFLMPRIQRMRSIIDFYNPKTRRQHCPMFNYQYLHRTARNLAAAVAALHARGYCIGDVNESNILVSDTALVTLVDTDSFQVRDPQQKITYRCEVGKPEFTPPELQGKTFAECDRTIEHDLFGLAVLIFQLLMEGTHPFNGIFLGAGEPPPYEARILAGHFTYSQQRRVPYTPPRISPPLSILHPQLQELFIRCFEEGHLNPQRRPSAQTWLAALAEAENELVTCTANNQHRYGKHLKSCPWCERRERLGGRDPFPSPEAVKLGQHLQPLPRPKTVITPTIDVPNYAVAAASLNSVNSYYKIRLPHKYLPVICGVLGMAVAGGLNFMNWSNLNLWSSTSDAPQTLNNFPANRPRSDYRHYYKQGKSNYKRGEYELAIESFSEAIAQNPQNVVAYVNRGNARYNIKDYEGAIEDFTQALQINPQTIKAYVNRGNSRYALATFSSDPVRDYKLAIADFNQALLLDTTEAEAYIRRGIVRYELAQYSGDAKQDFQLAIKDFNQAVSINPRKPEAFFQRGIVLYDLAQYSGDFENNYRQAIEDFNQAIRINPNLARVYVRRGIVRYELAQYGNQNSVSERLQALDDLQTAAKLFLAQGDIDSYQQTLSNICVVVDTKCDELLRNPDNYLLLRPDLQNPALKPKPQISPP
jgi:DNA-binding helix-hairpin-helix protein with protein kinase domain